MTVEELRSLDRPHDLPNDHLKALWHALHGEWDAAHRMVQNMGDELAEWTHACLHRDEGDISNARYWYTRCRRPYPGEIPMEAEISAILAELGD